MSLSVLSILLFFPFYIHFHSLSHCLQVNSPYNMTQPPQTILLFFSTIGATLTIPTSNKIIFYSIAPGYYTVHTSLTFKFLIHSSVLFFVHSPFGHILKLWSCHFWKKIKEFSEENILVKIVNVAISFTKRYSQAIFYAKFKFKNVLSTIFSFVTPKIEQSNVYAHTHFFYSFMIRSQFVNPDLFIKLITILYNSIALKII